MSSPRPTHDPTTAVDSDVDLHVPAQRREWRSHRSILAAIAVGGMVGASARHFLQVSWPAPSVGVPWATLVVNASGCLLIGVLMVYVVEVGGAHPLVRPFLGVGVLGGYTTFSTYAVETHSLLLAERPDLALLYLLGTPVVALLAVTAGVVAGRSGVLAGRRWVRRRSSRRGGRS
jgi:CrcB protein